MGAIVRYLWCTIGDIGSQARVVIAYLVGDVPATRCAVDAFEQIVDCCGLRLDNGGTGGDKIHFEVEAKLYAMIKKKSPIGAP